MIFLNDLMVFFFFLLDPMSGILINEFKKEYIRFAECVFPWK